MHGMGGGAHQRRNERYQQRCDECYRPQSRSRHGRCSCRQWRRRRHLFAVRPLRCVSKVTVATCLVPVLQTPRRGNLTIRAARSSPALLQKKTGIALENRRELEGLRFFLPYRSRSYPAAEGSKDTIRAAASGRVLPLSKGYQVAGHALHPLSLSCTMNFLKQLASPRGSSDSPPAAPAAPASPSGSGPSAGSESLASKESVELKTILTDGAQLAALVSAGLEDGTLEKTKSLEKLSELSARLLCRNRAQEAAKACAAALHAETGNAAAGAAAASLLPSYFRCTESSGDAGAGDSSWIWVSKLFLHTLPAAPEGTAMCLRFSLTATADGEGDRGELFDLSLKVMQIAPFVSAGAPKFAFSFGFTDVAAAQAADWTLDEGQRAKLTELQGMLGLASSRWTPIGVLAFLLAGAGCGQLDSNTCFATVLRAAKDGSRDELLASAGFAF